MIPRQIAPSRAYRDHLNASFASFHAAFAPGTKWASTSGVFFVTISVVKQPKGVAMTTEGHIAALERRHMELERMIEEELRHPSADDERLRLLKVKKLEVKDELARLKRQDAA